jgi:hypothetical protein
MTRSKLIAFVVAMFVGVAIIFIVQVKFYTSEIDTAREAALAIWVQDKPERQRQLFSFKQHCNGDDVKQYPSIYVCAQQHGAGGMLDVLQEAADSVSPPSLLFWLFG